MYILMNSKYIYAVESHTTVESYIHFRPSPIGVRIQLVEKSRVHIASSETDQHYQKTSRISVAIYVEKTDTRVFY